MDYVLICAVALIASGLTLFSGFGLATLLMPVFAIFFPIDVAVAMTALVHLLNNLFKMTLLGRHASGAVVLRFGLPAAAAAPAGAWVLVGLSQLPTLISYRLFGMTCQITIVKILVAMLMVFFAVWETVPAIKMVRISTRSLSIGGLLSGFFGGFSGHQGALRSAFLLKCDLSKETFIATGVVIACLVDVARLTVYWTRFVQLDYRQDGPLLLAATLSALAGALIGSRLISKITIHMIQLIVSITLIGLAACLAGGVI